MYPEKVYQIALQKIKNLGYIGQNMLIENFGSASEIFHASRKELKEFKLKKNVVEDILEQKSIEFAFNEYQICQEENIQIIFCKDPQYPERFKNIEGMAPLLFYKGNANLNSQKIVSIVGTRSPSTDGIIQCQQLVKELVDHQCLVVSGLAYGIDIASHIAAVNNGLPTIGVLGHGLKQIYPRDHKRYVQQILSSGGLLTQFFYDDDITREYFPMRNKLVAALCDVLIVVESKIKGGSMITANFANEYRKDVFAFPGKVKDEKSQGCNFLIKTHKAHLLEGVKDIEYITRWVTKPRVIQASLFEELSTDENKLVNLLRNNGEMHIDEISYKLNMSASSLSSLLLQLELKDYIKTIPGKRYLLSN